MKYILEMYDIALFLLMIIAFTKRYKMLYILLVYNKNRKILQIKVHRMAETSSIFDQAKHHLQIQLLIFNSRFSEHCIYHVC